MTTDTQFTQGDGSSICDHKGVKNGLTTWQHRDAKPNRPGWEQLGTSHPDNAHQDNDNKEIQVSSTAIKEEWHDAKSTNTQETTPRDNEEGGRRNRYDQRTEEQPVYTEEQPEVPVYRARLVINNLWNVLFWSERSHCNDGGQ